MITIDPATIISVGEAQYVTGRFTNQVYSYDPATGKITSNEAVQVNETTSRIVGPFAPADPIEKGSEVMVRGYYLKHMNGLLGVVSDIDTHGQATVTLEGIHGGTWVHTKYLVATGRTLGRSANCPNCKGFIGYNSLMRDHEIYCCSMCEREHRPLGGDRFTGVDAVDVLREAFGYRLVSVAGESWTITNDDEIFITWSESELIAMAKEIKARQEGASQPPPTESGGLAGRLKAD